MAPSVESVSMETLLRNKRFLIRRITNAKNAVENAFLENPSDEVAHRIAAYLDEWKADLFKLEEIDNDITDSTDFEGKSPKQIEELEIKVTKDYENYQAKYIAAKGKLNAMFSRLNKTVELTSRRSLENSVPGEVSASNPLVKLPDIPVPKFDGKMKNFTEWHSLFSAMIDENENLKSVQKLYFLKQALIGDASNLLKDYSLQEGLYESAFKYVKERYYNRRALIANHFNNLLELPAITNATLRETLDRVNAIIRGLKVCQIEVEKMSPLIAFIIVRKLPDRLRTDWENSYLDYSTYPSFEPPASFLQNRCFAYESVHSESDHKSTSLKVNVTEERKKQKTSLATVVKGKFHTASDCNSSKCRRCGKSHNTLLHREFPQSSSLVNKLTSEAEPRQSASSGENSLLVSAATTSSKAVQLILLPSAVVLVRTKAKLIKARVLLDTCSQVNLVSESFVRKHGVVSRSSLTKIKGVTPGDLESSLSVSLSVKSRFEEFVLEFDAEVVGRIPYQVDQTIIRNIQNLEPDLPLADCCLPHSTVDILIGGRHANSILLGRKKFLGNLCLEDSRFGWVAQGPINRSLAANSECCHLTTEGERDITRFFEIEEVFPPKPVLSEHELCQAHFSSTYARLVNGRFQVKLPLKRSIDSLADTYRQARAALIRLERSLDPITRSSYVEFMTEYRSLGHMKAATNLDVRRFFIPHLFVLRPDSSTTKFRTVFNASAKNQSGISLNEALMVGPTLQPDLFDILLRFRLYRIAFSGDISKMYRQVKVHPDDWPLQSILWRDSPTDPIQMYELTTLTYGTSPASYIATKCLQVLAEEIKSEHPEVSFAISSEFYMDDLLTGADTVEAAVNKRQLIQSTLESAHFPLRKYVSNSPEFLKSIDPSLAEPLQLVEFASTGAAKLLGLQWQPTNDSFFINAKPIDISNVTLTKRVISSLAARIFDPMGFVAPVVIRAKIMLQDLWREGKDWDDPVSPELDQSFRQYYSELHSLPSVKIPRYYQLQTESEFDLVAFCDASSRAYGAVVYMRIFGVAGIRSILVCAKSKVAPLKPVTIPRLELLGAVLLVRLLSRVAKTLNYVVALSTAFCDSTIVLAWIKGPGSKYQTFVRKRVEFINSIITFERWKYVRSTENQADSITRGISVKSLVDSGSWVEGPNWMWHTSIEASNVSLPEDPPECRKFCSVLIKEEPCDETFIARYSDFDKLVRITSLISNFIFQLKPSINKYDSLETHTRAVYMLCHVSQKTHFNDEITSLVKGDSLSCKSSLRALTPFLDTYGILRVGGRLHNSNLPYNTRHPIILLRRSRLAELLVRHIHEKYFHAYRSFTLGFLQSQFWIVGGATRLVKKVISKCVWCARMKGEVVNQLMGDLPPERTLVSRPFAYTGVDFAGPFTIRCTNHRSTKHVKYYAAFFVCFTTRAVHLEAVSDLSTNAFLAALQRFVARRGIPNTIWSDNATNFVGSKNVLGRHCQSMGCVWKFIPARSPHQGGIWEAAVKAGKKHFVAAAHGVILTAEQFNTILSQVEAVLNSRPLYRRHNIEAPESIDVLTPGHFLVGSHLLHAAPPEIHTNSLSDRLELQNKIVCSFWQLWKKSYLAQLQSRSKWKSDAPNIKVGDIVLLKEETPPLEWNLARVIKVLPDSQSRVRVVEVQSKGSSFCRSVQKLVKLPLESST